MPRFNLALLVFTKLHLQIYSYSYLNAYESLVCLLLFSLYLILKKSEPRVFCGLLVIRNNNDGICALEYGGQKIKAEDTKRHLIYFINLSKEVYFALWMFLSVTWVSSVELESRLLCDIIDNRRLLRTEKIWILFCSWDFLFFPRIFIGVFFTASFHLIGIYGFRSPSDTAVCHESF